MGWSDLSVLAVVPARGGSKGIPRKNLREVGGCPLIGWAARTIAQLPWIDAAVLSTDDAELVEIGRRHGLAVPFMRPAEFATDGADSVGMWRHAWLASEQEYGRRFDLSILLQPTTPLRRASDVERTVRQMVEAGHKAAATVSELPGHYTPEKCLTVGEDGTLSFYVEGGSRFSQRQRIPSYHHRNGVCYAVRRSTLVDDGHIIEDDCAAVVVEGFVVNIDDPFELELAEFMLKRQEDSGASGL